MIWLLTALVKACCWFVAIMPRRLQLLFGNLLGLTWFYIVPVRRSVAIGNLKKAFPDWSDSKLWSMARKNFQHYGCGFIELLLLPSLTEKRFNKLFRVENFEIYKTAASQGRGIFLLTLHIGTWELMSATSSHLKIPLNVITKKFKAGTLNQLWVNLRTSRGIKLLREEKSTFDILKAIRRGEAVGFILDQFMGPPVGSKTVFFGHETGTPAALALFVDRTRAPVIPVYNIRQSDGTIRVVFEPPIPFLEQGSTEKNISLMTQVYTGKIEEIVRKYPDQWLWIHRRWKPFRT